LVRVPPWIVPNDRQSWHADAVASVLDREMYTEAEAARLLRVAKSTLHYWLEGGERRGKTYQPIVRIEPRGAGRPVTWAEFVEAGFLRAYRRDHQVPMAELREFIDTLREKFGVPYPLADRRPFVAGRQLVYDAQTAADLDAEFCLVAVANNQLILTGPAQIFVDKVVWDGDVPAGWKPDQDLDSPVRIDPDLRFGRPAIRGITTEAIWEQADVGEEIQEIAETYRLSISDVRWALAYENSLRAA
jgi:uncharacterized protein (DUF433 family)